MVKRKKGKRKSRRCSTMEDVVTVATVDEDESGDKIAKVKKKSPCDLALERFAIATVAKKIEGLQAEFASLKTFVPPLVTQTAFELHKDCNRYNNVACYDSTRVVLKYMVPPEKDYIHANYVRTKLCTLITNFICTQGPLDSTVNDFWRMIWQEKPKSIIMLCKIFECGKQKCSQYFPFAPGETRCFGNICVQIIKKISPEMEKVFEAVQINFNAKGEAIQTLTLYRWLDWPDFGVPASGMGMLRILRQIRDNPGSSTVVHCSAGVGRTGTIVACEICLRILLEGKDLNVLEVIKEMRTQRAGSVQTEGQYVYLHKTLCEYVNAKKLAREKIAEFFVAYLNYASKATG